MEFKDILAISGQPGLYKYVAQSARGIIVESLGDGKRMNASATARVSALAEISMFTEGEDIPLADVFTRMYAHTGGKEALSPKATPDQMKAYFAEVLPEYDRESACFGYQEGVVLVQHPCWCRLHRVHPARRACRGVDSGSRARSESCQRNHKKTP